MSKEKLYKNLNLFTIVTFAIIVRWSVSLHSYSGENKPPMYGDYEAQRHWMEITLNLPLEEWYQNSSINDLNYWGLDYPPLTAYHSYVNGMIAHYLNPDFVSLQKSKGYESYDHKFFMRATVIIADLMAYFIPAILFFNSVNKNKQNYFELNYGECEESDALKLNNIKSTIASVPILVQIAIALLYPGLILIDHGHFQYNSISLGFTVLAVSSIVYNKLFIAAIYFCLALNYKQMSLYHSLPIFVYMLSKCLQFKKFISFRQGIQKLCFLSFTVLMTFGIIWFPFLIKKNVFLQVVKRLFPLKRGIFEDKVSNFWCALNIIYKLNQTSDKVLLAKLCIACVLISSLWSLINLFKHPNFLKLILSLINVSLSFFLFSYQVHEKSILLVALPVLMFFPFDPFPCFWFLLISTFSMLPLFLKDGLIIPFASLSILFTFFALANVDFHMTLTKKIGKNSKVFFFKKNVIIWIVFKLSLLGCFILTQCIVFLEPPLKYPDLWPLLISVYSFGHFILFGFYFNFVQISQVLD